MPNSPSYDNKTEEDLCYLWKFRLTLLFFTLYRLWFIYAEIFDLSADEAHYWEWSRRLDLNYYSKGPVVAYLIRFFTSIGENSPFFVRLGAVSISVLFAVLVYHFSLKLFRSHRIAFYTVLIFEASPLFFAGGIFMTIDPPFIFFWLLSLYLIYMGLLFPNNKLYWLGLGLSSGIGFLCKYTMFLIYPILWVYFFFNRDEAKKVGARNVLLAHGVSLLFIIPPVIWNLRHDWATFRHVSGQVSGSGFSFVPFHFFEFFFSQVGALSPVFFIGIILVWFLYFHADKLERTFETEFLFWFSFPVFFVFFLRSFFGKVQANWAAPAYVASIFALVGVYFGKINIRRKNTLIERFFVRKWAKIGFTISAFILFFGSFPRLTNPVILPLVKKGKSNSVRISGWKELGSHIDKLLEADKSLSFVFSDSYQVTSEVAFYAKKAPVSLCAPLGRRKNQYDYWPGFDAFLGKNALFVKEARNRIVPRLKKAFATVEPLEAFIIKRNGQFFKVFYISKCSNFIGFEKENISKREF